jgi:hypothetical protein
MSISHALRRPQMQLSPDQWVPLANATNMFNNITSNNSTSSETYQEPGAAGNAFLLRFFLVVLFCFCAKPRIPDERYHRHPRRGPCKEGPKVRGERIEQSLAVKRVVTTDTEGGLILGEPSITEADSADGDDASKSHHSTEENEDMSTCIICLEPFRVGDTVAWSKQSTIPRSKADEQPCLHVFHRDCIVPWLTNPKHDDCPACRSTILQDSPGESTLEDEDLEAPSSIQPFVIIDGMVSRMRHASSFLIGQSIDVSAADCVEDNDEDDDDRLSNAPQP